MKRSAFTLAEVLVAIILLGIAIVAILGTNTVLTQSNAAGLELSTADFLSEQIKELTMLLPAQDPGTGTSYFGSEETGFANWDDIDDFDDASFCPPINADRETLNMFGEYRQEVTVQNVSSTNFANVVADNTTAFLKVTVTVWFNSKPVSTVSWIRARY